MKTIPNEASAQSTLRQATATQAPGRLRVQAMPGGLGAEMRGIDLNEPVSDRLRREVLAAFLAHRVLVFRKQQLTKRQMGALAEIFGELEGNVFRNPDGTTMAPIHEISNLDAAGRPAENPYLKSNYHWHSDKAYLAMPALLTMLHAVELPPTGGDTQFADMTRAYASLPDEQKQRIGALRVVHSLEYMRVSTGDRPASEAEKDAAPPVTHPLVRTHPETGEKSLFLGMYCSRIVGIDDAEGHALLVALLAHATQERFVYTHQWQRGDLVLWDNRCLLHRAVANYQMTQDRRVLQRLVVKGTAPP